MPVTTTTPVGAGDPVTRRIVVAYIDLSRPSDG